MKTVALESLGRFCPLGYWKKNFLCLRSSTERKSRVSFFCLPVLIHQHFCYSLCFPCVCMSMSLCLFPCCPSLQRVIRGRSQSLDTMGIAMRKQQQQQPPATLPSRPATAGLALNPSIAEGPKAIAAVRFCGIGAGQAN